LNPTLDLAEKLLIWYYATITADCFIISLTINLFLPWYSWKIAEFGVKQQSFTHSIPLLLFLWLKSNQIACTTSHLVGFVLCVFSELQWEGLVLFVYIGGIVDHHCLNFLVIVHESLAMHQFIHTQIFSLPILKLNCIFFNIQLTFW